MAVTGSGVSLSYGDTLHIFDGDGNLVTSVRKAQAQENDGISSPVAAPDGSLYFADRSYAYRVDGMGRPIWQKPFGADQSAGRASAQATSLALDPSGRLYVSALDGKVWTFRGEDGQVLSSVDLGLWQNNRRYLYFGLGEIVAVDRGGIATAGPGIAAMGLISPQTSTWLGEVAIGDGSAPTGAFAGYDIGLVATAYVSTTSEVAETDVFDRCGNFRWRVPGSYAVPLAITFDDDLIVMDRVPNGRPSPSDHDFSLRRFSKDGILIAGPTSVSDTFCGRSFVGSDDTFYYTGGASDGYRLRAFDSALHEIWAIPFPHCPEAAVLSTGGKIFTARGGVGGKLVAVQTTSPGPAPVSWPQAVGRDARATLWLAP